MSWWGGLKPQAAGWGAKGLGQAARHGSRASIPRAPGQWTEAV